MIAESQTQHNIVVWDFLLVSLTSWPVDPHCLTTKPGKFSVRLTFMSEAFACGMLVTCSEREPFRLRVKIAAFVKVEPPFQRHL